MSSIDNHPPVFIVSTGRCGSTLMSRIINMHPDILSLNEFFMSLAGHAFTEKAVDGEGLWRLLSKATTAQRLVFHPDVLVDEFLYPYSANSHFRLEDEDLPPLLFTVLPHITDRPDELYFELEPQIRALPKRQLGAQYQYLFALLRDRLGKTMWIERSGASLVFLPKLKQHFPDARYIHIYRDGRDVAMSLHNHAPSRLFAHTWQSARRFGINPLRPPFVLGASKLYTRLEPLAVRLFSIQQKLDTPLPYPVTGAFWSDLVDIGLRHLADVPPERLLNLRYEDLVENPREELTKLLHFVAGDLPLEPWLTEASALPGARPQAWRELPDAAQAALTKACAPGLKALGYSH